jgi:ferritin-like metal-binding protein YciE
MKTDVAKSKNAKSASAKTVKPAAKKAAPAPVAEVTEAKEPSEQSEMLRKFFVDGLKDIYWAEKHAIKALPKMRKAATTPALAQAIEEHGVVTATQAERLEQAFEMLGKKAQAKKCDAMAGLIEEGYGILEETEKGSVTRDVGIIMAAQKIEHYEIATYGGLVHIAKTLGENQVADLLQKTLDEEKQADELLIQIALDNINEEALND